MTAPRATEADLRRAVMLRWAEHATGQTAVVVALRATP